MNTSHHGDGGFNARPLPPNTTNDTPASSQLRGETATPAPRVGRDGRPLILTGIADAFEAQYEQSRIIDHVAAAAGDLVDTSTLEDELIARIRRDNSGISEDDLARIREMGGAR